MQLDFFEDDSNNSSEIHDTDSCDHEMKDCYVCKTSLPFTKQYFNITNSTKAGSVHLKRLCKKCDGHAVKVRKQLHKENLHKKTDYCDCCGKHVSETKNGFHLDHCYLTDTFRGYLCLQCNRGIGNMGESIEGLQKGIDYLKRAMNG